jgi:hypothetical protein
VGFEFGLFPVWIIRRKWVVVGILRRVSFFTKKCILMSINPRKLQSENEIVFYYWILIQIQESEGVTNLFNLNLWTNFFISFFES